MAKKKTKHVLKKKSYGSLSDVKNEIEASGVEKVIEFSGYALETNKGTYGLYDGDVSFEEKK